MPKINTAKQKLLFLLTAMIIAGCVPLQHLADLNKSKLDKAAELPDKWELLNLYPNLKGQEFQKEIVQLESLIDNNSEPTLRAKLHLRLGLLHLDSKNPNPNYLTAVKELESSLTLDPKGERKGEVQNLIQLLREMRKMTEENKKIKAKTDQLTQENQEIKKENLETKKENLEVKNENQELKKNVEQLKDLVEQLKNLDVNIEERRKKIK